MRVEIVQSMVGAFNVGARELRVCADTEVIVRFIEPRYDYLRYLDEGKQCISLVWLPAEAYEMLVEFGIPETIQRGMITSEEYNCWLEYRAMAEMDEFEADATGEEPE